MNRRNRPNVPQIAVVGVLFGLVLGVQLASIRTVNAPATTSVASPAGDVPACPTTAINESSVAGNPGVPGEPTPDGVHRNGKAALISAARRPTARKKFANGYASPVGTMMNSFKTSAMEREVHKHDRWVVDSLAYLTKFDNAAAYTRYATTNQSAGAASTSANTTNANHQSAVESTSSSTSSSSPAKLMTLVVLTVKRAVPYVAVLVAMLLRGHHPAVFMEKMDVHIANIERRTGRERHYIFDDLREKLGTFVTFHNWTAKYPQHANISDHPYMENQRLDYIKALRICQAAESKWCVIMEDDAVPCVDFASKFERYVDRDVFPSATALGGRADVPLDKVAVVKLYDHHNEAMLGLKGRDVSHPEYAREDYDRDRALDWLEAEDAGAAALDKVRYTVRRVNQGYGIVANAYPYGVLERAIAFQEKSKVGKPTDTSLVSDFPTRAQLQRLGTSPSLVNHLGFYSENYGQDWTRRGVSTDVRFQLDDVPDVSDARRRRDKV